MAFQKEAPHLWLFESHNNSKRSQWLQSTLSEVDEKMKVILKLIQCDADTFAQRAEMYYRSRPELVNMIEDFYRAYRSLAERHNQLKLESGNPFSKRSFHKEWSFSDQSCASSVTCDSESVVDDAEEKEEHAESKLMEVQSDEIENDDQVNPKYEDEEILIGKKIKGFTYSVESELGEITQKKNEKFVIDQVTEAKVRNAASSNFQHFEPLYSEAKGQAKNYWISERNKSTMEKMSEKSSDLSFDHLITHGCEIEETEPENKIEEEQESKFPDGITMLMNEVKRLKQENFSLKAEIERKDEEKREVIKQLSISVDLLKEENDFMRKTLRNSKKKVGLFEFRKLKAFFSEKLFGGCPKPATTIVAL